MTTKVEEFLAVARKHIAGFAQRARDDGWMALCRRVGLSNADMMKGAIHGETKESAESGVHDHKALSWPLVGRGVFDIGDTRDDIGGWRDKIAARLDFRSNGTIGKLAKSLLCLL